MRDATKLIVLRQEHNSQLATKARHRLLTNFRQQGEEHKQELERLERKLLTISEYKSMAQKTERRPKKNSFYQLI